MAANRKPRKQHKARTPSIPMMAATRDRMALDLHAAVETLIHAPDIESYNHVSTKLIALGRVAGERDCLESAKEAMGAICDRFQRVGKMGVSEHEAHQLRKASGDMDSMIGTIPVNRMIKAEVETRIWYENEWLGQ